jgi:hypothetical protein
MLVRTDSIIDNKDECGGYVMVIGSDCRCSVVVSLPLRNLEFKVADH